MLIYPSKRQNLIGNHPKVWLVWVVISDLKQTKNSLKLLQLLRKMKVLVLVSVCIITICIILQDVSSISTLDEKTYDIFVKLIKGEFALVRFWRNRDKLSLSGGMLCFNGKSIVKKEGLRDVVRKMYKSPKGSGVRKIYHKLKNSYSGIAERDVQKVLAKSTIHQRFNVCFGNKARFRLVVPKQSKFAIKLTWWTCKDYVLTTRGKDTSMFCQLWTWYQPVPLVSATANKAELQRGA